MKELREWNFRNGVEVCERYFEGGKLHGFKVYYTKIYDGYDNDYMGAIIAKDEYDFEKLAARLNKGEDPIQYQWDSGRGHTCTVDQWDYTSNPDEASAYGHTEEIWDCGMIDEFDLSDIMREQKESEEFEDELLRQEERENWKMK